MNYDLMTLPIEKELLGLKPTHNILLCVFI